MFKPPDCVVVRFLLKAKRAQARATAEKNFGGIDVINLC